MFNKFRVITMTRNIEDGETTFKEEFNTKKEALDKFYYDCNSYGTNPNTKTCEVVIFDNKGDLIKVEKIDNTQYAPIEE